MNLFDSVWQLLKYDEDDDEDVYGDPEEYNSMFYEGDGSPRDPRKNPAYDEEDFILDDMQERILDHEIRQLRQSPGFYDKPEPAVTEEERKEEELKQHIADFLQSQKLASQPMDLAWQMLKKNEVINLTPHPLNMYLQGQREADGEPDLTIESQGNFRVPMKPPKPSPGDLEVSGHQVPLMAPPEWEDIPEELDRPSSGQVYVVSRPSAVQHAKQFGPREDIFTVGRTLRDEKGSIAGASSFGVPEGMPDFKPRKVA